jgi:peptidyl-prolyl cis-trans isomerase D
MLNLIRKRSSGALGILIIGAVALVFIFWGVGGRDSGTADDIKFDGHPVSQAAFAEANERILDRLRSQNSQLTEEQIVLTRRQTLSGLLERHNLLTLALATGRRPSVEAINVAIKSNPDFQTGGLFDRAKYEELAPRLYNRSLKAVEALYGEDQIATETADLVSGLSYVPSGSLLDDYHFTDDQVAANWVFFPAKVFAEGLSPEEADLMAFYELEKERWRRPAQIRAEYVEVKVEDYLDQIEVTQEDLDDAYLEEREEKPEEAEVNHILFRFPNFDPSEEEKAEVRAAAEAALARARTEDFAELA